MPRKAAVSTEGDAVSAESQLAPRRSSRISSQPKVETKEEVKEKQTRATGKKGTKRSADDQEKDEGEETSSKKPKGVDDGEGPDGGEIDELAGDSSTLANIDIGDSLPSLTLKNEKGDDIDVASLASDKGVIFFLVPKADTPGCTTQACGFRNIYPDFTSSNFDVYCLSADTPTAQSKWQTKKSLPYPLLSDAKRVLISALGAGDGGKTKRSHFIFEKGGKLVDKKIPVKPADSPKLALEFVKSLQQD